MLCGNALLRTALRRNLVTFPSQVPAFAKQPAGHIQQGAVQLYFVRGWTVRRICLRYGLGKKIVQNLLSDWRMRAISAGLIQEIQSEDLTQLLLEQQPDEKDGHLTAFRQPADPPHSADLMNAFREDLLELGVELSSDQMRMIERIVRDVASPRGAPSPAGREADSSHMTLVAEVRL